MNLSNLHQSHVFLREHRVAPMNREALFSSLSDLMTPETVDQDMELIPAELREDFHEWVNERDLDTGIDIPPRSPAEIARFLRTLLAIRTWFER